MKTEIVTSTDGLAALDQEWEELERRDSSSPYYVTHRFVTAWWQAYRGAADIDLHIVVVRDGDRLVGVGPFSVRKHTVRFASHGDYMDVLVDPEASTDAVCRTIVEALTSPERVVERINVGNVRADGHLAHHLLKSARNAEFTLHVENPYIDLASFDSLDDYAERAGIPSHTRKYRNKLLREREVSFRVYRGDEDDILTRLARVHRAEKEFLVRSKDRDERYSLFEDPARESLVRAVFDHTDDAITFGYEDPAGELVGYRTCFHHGRTLLSWNSAYHPNLHPYRIGKVIQLDILEHLLAAPAAEREVDTFDFGAGRYPWKFEWTGRFAVTYRWRHTVSEPTRESSSKSETVAAEPAVVNGPPPPAAPGSTQAVPLLRKGVRAARRIAKVVRSAGRKLTNPPVIWYIPHPDDETIFMGGSIHRTRDRRNILVLLTEGGASGSMPTVNAKLDRPLNVAAFMAGRVTEMSAALSAIGVRERDVVRHDLPDGALEDDDVLAVITTMAHKHAGAEHRTMSYLDPHRDHAAAGRALREAHRQGTVTDVVFHLPVPLVSTKLGTRARLGRPDVAAKRKALREYQVWDPMRGRYAIGGTSVTSLIRDQLAKPIERVHGPDYEATASPSM